MSKNGNCSAGGFAAVAEFYCRGTHGLPLDPRDSGTTRLRPPSIIERRPKSERERRLATLASLGLFHDFDNAPPVWIHQNSTVVHDGVAIVAYAVFLGTAKRTLLSRLTNSVVWHF
jgi:hypothetical protein